MKLENRSSLNKWLNISCLSVFFMLISLTVTAQSVTGFVYDSDNNPLPFVKIYFKNLGTGTETDGEGKYYHQFGDPGVYQLVINAIGYKDRQIDVIIENREEVVKNIWLESDSEELNEVIVSSKRRDPAYGIIQDAIKNKSKWKSQFNSSTCSVYIKASEVISEKEKKRRKREEEQKKIQEQNERKEEEDVFAAEAQKRKQEIYKIAGSMNMQEVNLTRHYEAPNNIKEIREGVKKHGSTYGLFYTSTNEADFNFYDNLMNIATLNELPLVSPLHVTSVLTYKFKLEETEFVNDRMLYKIKVTPRKKGNASWNGYIWILDKDFCVYKVDLNLHKAGLYIYDDFTIQQEFKFIEDSVLVLTQQNFQYESKSGKREFTGKTDVTYEDYIINPTFEKRFFKNEVAVTTQEAYEKDSTYWDKIRPKPLSKEEQRYQFIKDSLYAHVHSDIYLDSVDSVFNRITFMDAFWDGFAFSDRKKKKYWDVSSLMSMFDPFEIGGLRFGPGASFFKKWKNEKFLWANVDTDVGLRNKDFKATLSLRHRYDPMHLGYIGVYGGELFNTIVENDALSNIFMRANWIEEGRITAYHGRELINGLYLQTNFHFVDRRPINKYQFGNITADWFDGNPTLDFERYQTFIFTANIEYTPFQKYMTEPYRKIILGSKWPTLGVHYENGVNGLFGSDIQFQYLSASIRQTFKLGTMGTSSYHVKGGKFIDTTDLRYVDYKIFPRGDRYFFASLMQSMQIQDTTLTATDLYFQAHYVHHFNGAIINYIPLVKKLGVHLVAGASALYITESNYKYGEVFVGAERSFKAQRARYRVGLYFVAAESNYSNITPRIKFAFNRYNLRDQSWGF